MQRRKKNSVLSCIILFFYTLLSKNILSSSVLNVKKKYITKKRNSFFFFRLVKDLPIRNIYAQFVGPCGSDHILPESLQKEGILNINALIETNLRILFVGDSVGMQFSHIFQESSFPIDRNVLRYSKGLHETSHIVLTKDGGRISGLRVNGLPLEILADQAGLMPPLKVSIISLQNFVQNILLKVNILYITHIRVEDLGLLTFTN